MIEKTKDWDLRANTDVIKLMSKYTINLLNTVKWLYQIPDIRTRENRNMKDTTNIYLPIGQKKIK